MNSGKACQALGRWMKWISSARRIWPSNAHDAMNAGALWKQIHIFVAAQCTKYMARLIGC